ncbi:molybdenum cofactor synthesis domain-containing protein [Aequitasia blattaphilus]|uniref:Molybdopterin molybdenumtransferase n=1 Tax=Aequitasia blattaphilus TaxID=2949332 RepID=A0ABT1E8F7_9FIRM|nr:molybdopterin-binding protein [Aequitasia blattaphilus]MCP1102100.1 molybdopterin-binding protein [Aequitasia blattaphilus]MCR8614740.1 molybdopterin-binding protein [Aequitasia blattaphilus]
MELVDTKEAVGHVLCHDITQIVRGKTKDAVFRKGHIVREEDIPVLLSLGKEHLYVWEQEEGMLHENEAADILREIAQGKFMTATKPKEGKIELIAERDGLLKVDTERLNQINGLGEMMVATLPSGLVVKKGDKLCGTRVIPLVIEKEKMDHARSMIGEEPLLELLPLKQVKYSVITTGSEVFKGRIQDTFTPVLIDKMSEYGCELMEHKILDDNHQEITTTIQEMLKNGAEMILCTGGMSVDPDDKTPLAIKNTGAQIVSYGAPVLPGAMFLLAYTKTRTPILGLPGCVMYAKRTIFDLVLPLLLAEIPVTKEWIADLGNGGLCRNCEVCHFPNCGFWKGV